MQLVTKASLLAAIAVISASMLIDTVEAVEVSGKAAPRLPVPQVEAPMAAESLGAPTPPTPDCFILGSRSFSIPFTVDAAGTQPVEVHLFVARGPGQEWQRLDRKRPDVAVKQFQFTAEQDGEYWFATRTMDAQGHPHPAGAIQSQLKVYVDTTKPRVTLSVDADATGRVDAVLAIDDATPLKNVQLRYVTDNVNQWQNVDIPQLPKGGKLQFKPTDSWKQLSLQFVATDTAGNQSVITQLLRRPRLAESSGSRYAAAPTSESTPASSMPYRMSASEEVHAHTVSNPVIQLDRNRQRPAPNLTTADGYVTESPRGVPSPFNAYRGSVPPPRGPSPVTRSPQFAPAPQQTPAPLQTSVAQRPAPQAPPRAQAAPVIPTPGMQIPSGMQAAPSPQLNAAPPAAFSAAPRPQARSTAPAGPLEALDRLFGSPATPSAAPQRFSFGPPSIRSVAVPTNPPRKQSVLPPPATPQEISHGFNLNSPGQAAPETKPHSPQASKTRQSRARTPAEAMRPITEKSAASATATNSGAAADAGTPQVTQEEIPTPKPERDVNAVPYRSMRSTPVESAIAMGRAPIRYSDSERFSLEYELEAVGSQGVDEIELFGSVDGGKSWELWGQDPDQISPFDIETKEAGVFGFRIVVVGRNGLASPRPLNGESPDIVVVVDKTTPQVRITGAQYGEGDRIGSLVIRYECRDVYLVQRPIALSFSDSLQGPWTTIAAGLRNDGDYVWPADPQLPRQLYLRIDATDHAGNVGTYILDQPIDAQGLAPRARIRGFQSLSGGEPLSTQEQTAKRPQAAFK